MTFLPWWLITLVSNFWSSFKSTRSLGGINKKKLKFLLKSITVEETTVEGETPIEGDAEVDAEGATTTKEGKDKSVKTADEKTKDKSVKPSGDKAEASSSDKGKSLNKEPKKK